MTQLVEFPGLGWSFEIDRVAFHLPDFLGGLAVYWYGIIIALGFFLAVAYVLSRVKTFGLDGDRVFDVILIAIISGVIGARLYYVVFSWEDYRYNLLKILNFREGGLAIYGGIIFGILGGFIAAKLRDVKFLPLLDLAVGAIFIGQSIGRWGNFINVEAFGGNTTLPWGMTGPSIVSYLQSQKPQLEAIGMTIDPTMPVHPTFFYESFWCLLGFLVILWMTKRRRYDGQLSLFYLGWYGAGRAVIEGLRTDSLMMGGVRISQLVAILCVIASIVFMALIRTRIRKADNPEYLQLYVNTKEGQEVLAGTYYQAKEVSKEDSSEEDLEETTNTNTEYSTEDSTEDNTEEIKEETVKTKTDDESEIGSERQEESEDETKQEDA